MYTGTEGDFIASSAQRKLQFECHGTIHKLTGIETVLVFFIFLYALGTQRWGPGFGLDNLVFWYGISIVFCLVSIAMYAITDVYAATAFVGFTVAFLVFNLLIFIDTLPQFWEVCTHSYCHGVAQDFFHVFFVFLVLLIFVVAAICYNEFRMFRLEGTNSRLAGVTTSFYQGYNRLATGGNRLVRKPADVYKTS